MLGRTLLLLPRSLGRWHENKALRRRPLWGNAQLIRHHCQSKRQVKEPEREEQSLS
jgi:hypothetical protein